MSRFQESYDLRNPKENLKPSTHKIPRKKSHPKFSLGDEALFIYGHSLRPDQIYINTWHKPPYCIKQFLVQVSSN